MILTGQQILDIAQLAGFDIIEDTFGQDILETEISIQEWPDGSKYAYYTEYPEESSIQLESQ